MSKVRKYLLNSFQAAAVLAAAIFLLADSTAAYDMEAIQRDVKLYFSTIHCEKSLKDYYHLEGEGGEGELEYELQVCRELGVETDSDVCTNYLRCRYENKEQVVSYSYTAESRLVPVVDDIAPDSITVKKGPEGYVPHVMVHVRIDGHVYSFYRSTGKSEAPVFGLLSLSRIDGKPIKLPDIDLMEVFNSDPCRDILLKKQ